MPGFLEYRLDFGKLVDLPRSAREQITVEKMLRFQLRAHVFQAARLPAMDEDGLCNPYTVVTLAGYAGQSRVAAPTCDPQWYESVIVDLELPHPTPLSSKILVQARRAAREG